MSFTGFSSDDEGSIVYDGKKFIVNNPNKVPDDFNPGDKEVAGLPENHPSHPKNRKPPPIPKYVPPAVIYTAFDKHRAEEHRKRVEKVKNAGKPEDKKKKEPAQEVTQPTLPPDYVGDIPASPLVLEQSWAKKLSEGQKLQIDYLLSTEGEPLVSDMLLALKYEGMPEWISFDDFMKRFAEWGWDEEADQRAREVWQSIMQAQAGDSTGSLPAFGDGWWYQRIEETLADQANDTIESLQVIDANTGQVLLNRIGVLGAAGQQYLGLQAEDIRPFQNHDLIFVHNHPNGTAASEADLQTAFAAGAEMLLVVTPRGYEYVYIRGERGMVPAHEGEASYEVDPATAAEHVELEGRSWRQAQMDKRNPPELFLFQDAVPAFRADLIEFADMLNIDSNPATLSDTELLREILTVAEKDVVVFGKAVPSFLDNAMEHPLDTLGVRTDLYRALYIRETAELTGVPPAILAMVQLWENNARSGKGILETGPYELVYRLGGRKSLGISQVQIPVAIDMLNKYPEWFEDLNLPTDDMQDVWGGYELQDGWSNYDVGYQLQVNDEFNLRVAGAYLADFQTRLEPYLARLGVVVSDESIDEPHISRHELTMLTLAGYNQGWDHALAKLRDRFNEDGPEEVIKGVRDTVDIAHIHNVFSREDEAIEKYGLFYKRNRDEG